MKLIFLITSLVLLSGCNKNEVIQRCHDRVQNEATFTAQIVTTEAKREKFDYVLVSGRAKMQNGFGAWTNYRYSCQFTGITITNFRLETGW